MMVARVWVGLLRFVPHGGFCLGVMATVCGGALLRLKPSRHHDKQRILFALRHVDFFEKTRLRRATIGRGSRGFCAVFGVSGCAGYAEKKGREDKPLFFRLARQDAGQGWGKGY